MTADIWEEYRNQSDQTICIVGVLILSAKLCTADGKKLSLYEKDAILNEFKTTDTKEREAILDILPIVVGGTSITALSFFVGLGIFIFLLSKNSTIGEHDG